MNPKQNPRPSKNAAALTIAIVVMLVAVLTACSPAAEEPPSRSNAAANPGDPPQATIQPDVESPTPGSTPTRPRATPTPESPPAPTQQPIPTHQQPTPTAASQTPTPEPEREYTLDELRHMLIEMGSNRPFRSRPIALGQSHAAQIRAEDAARHCLGIKGDERHMQQQSKWASTEDYLPLLYWDTSNYDSATALILSGDDAHHIGTVIMSQVCTQDTPYTAHDRASIIEEIRQTIPIPSKMDRNDRDWWVSVRHLFERADTMHVGIALADAPHRGYYIYLMFTRDDPIEWIEPPTVEGTELKASGKILEDQDWITINHIRAIRPKVSDEAWHRCYRHKQAIVFFTYQLERTWEYALRGASNRQRRDIEWHYESGDNFYSFPSIPDTAFGHHVVFSELENRCLWEHARPPIPQDARFPRKTMYLIQTEGAKGWSYDRGQSPFTVTVDLTPLIENPEYDPGMYFVHFEAQYRDHPLLYPIWLGMDPPDDHPYRQP